MYTKFLIDILGWIVSVLYRLAYTLVSAKKTEGDSLLYRGMNIFAAILLIVYMPYLVTTATTGLNDVWVGIGVFTLGTKWLLRN